MTGKGVAADFCINYGRKTGHKRTEVVHKSVTGDTHWVSRPPHAQYMTPPMDLLTIDGSGDERNSQGQKEPFTS